MAVFRIEKTKDYTVMANHHLKNRSLSLKAKGLLSVILSLPENWNYTTRGLASICKEGVIASPRRFRNWSKTATSCAIDFVTRKGALPIRSTSSTKSPSLRRKPLHLPNSRPPLPRPMHRVMIRCGRKRRFRIRSIHLRPNRKRLRHMRLTHVRKTRIWICRTRKTPRN